MALGQKLKQFYTEPFKTVDNLRPTLFGKVFNPFLKYDLNRKMAFVFAIGLGLIPWMLFGFDSCIAQPLMLLYRMPEYLMGSLSYGDWWNQTWVAYYGKEMHYSAILFYGLAFWALSKHYKNLGITKSKNVAYACVITLLSVALFEWYWIGSYAYWQRQPWVITFRMPQLKVLYQNTIFTVLGFIGVLYMWADSYFHPTTNKRLQNPRYRFRINKIALGLTVLSITLAVVWWYYPWYVEHITVPFTTGEVWTNSRHFPQTLYTLDVNPTDSMNAGVWFFVQNNLIHGWNTLVKLVWTITVVYIGMIQPVGGDLCGKKNTQ